MSFIEFEAKVKDEAFMEYLNNVYYGFVRMINTMKDVARVVRENTLPVTPFETGALGRSFNWKILTDNNRDKVLMVEMDAVNQRTGYHYAFTQHRGYHRNKYGHIVEYNQLKFIPTGKYSHVMHRGHSEFLYWGIKESEDDAFIIIEDDYLSLFKGKGGQIF